MRVRVRVREDKKTKSARLATKNAAVTRVIDFCESVRASEERAFNDLQPPPREVRSCGGGGEGIVYQSHTCIY